MRRCAFFIDAARAANGSMKPRCSQPRKAGHLAGAALEVGMAPDQTPSPALAVHPAVPATPHIGGLTRPATEHQAMEPWRSSPARFRASCDPAPSTRSTRRGLHAGHRRVTTPATACPEALATATSTTRKDRSQAAPPRESRSFTTSDQAHYPARHRHLHPPRFPFEAKRLDRGDAALQFQFRTCPWERCLGREIEENDGEWRRPTYATSRLQKDVG